MPPAAQSDPAFVLRLRQRDPEALAATVKEHARPLYRMALGMGFRPQEAEDLVQDVFTVFLETLDKFEGRSLVGTWLFGILHRKMHERRRALQREEAVDSLDPTFEAQFDLKGYWIGWPTDVESLFAARQIGESIAECLSALPLRQREVFLLREVEGIASKEICNNLQLTVTHFGVLIHRARHSLRQCMQGKGWR
jgi:RNA polymerase sigma-70 factor, ECF subfamily